MGPISTKLCPIGQEYVPEIKVKDPSHFQTSEKSVGKTKKGCFASLLFHAHRRKTQGRHCRP